MGESSEDSATEQPARRRGPGRPWKPGETGNPGGRPKGFAALIREKTRDGETLVEFAHRVHQGLEVEPSEATTVKERVAIANLRLDAGKWLADRGWGAARQEIEHSTEEGSALVVQVVQQPMPEEKP